MWCAWFNAQCIFVRFMLYDVIWQMFVQTINHGKYLCKQSTIPLVWSSPCQSLLQFATMTAWGLNHEWQSSSSSSSSSSSVAEVRYHSWSCRVPSMMSLVSLAPKDPLLDRHRELPSEWLVEEKSPSCWMKKMSGQRKHKQNHKHAHAHKFIWSYIFYLSLFADMFEI